MTSLRYAQVWEDARVLRAALRVNAGDRVLSIAAAGDNALALLLDDPAVVVAVDYEPAQLALTHLKVAALRALDGPSLRAFLGAAPSSRRARLARYRELAPELPAFARAFFDERPGLVAGGVIHGGKLERYFNLFRRVALPLVQPRSTVRAYLAARSLDEQRELFDRARNNPRWRLLFRVFFSRALLGRLGRDARLFDLVEQRAIATSFLERLERAFVELPAADNYVAEYFMTGRLSGANGLPAYLDDANLPRLRARLHRLALVEGELGACLESRGRFDAFNLSDVFEWLDDDEAARLYGRVLDAASPGARVAYWHLLRPRAAPGHLVESDGQRDEQLPASLKAVDRDEQLAASLKAVDRCFFYGGLHVETVRPADTKDATERRAHAG